MLYHVRTHGSQRDAPANVRAYQKENPMNTAAPKKRINPWIPGTAIVALLAATATMPGAHAQWSDSSTVPSTSISAGDLDLSAGPTAWTLNGVAFDPTTERLAAGDIVVGKTVIDAILEGDNLQAQITAKADSTGTTGSVTGTIQGEPLLTQSGQVDSSLQVQWTGSPSYGIADQVTASLQTDLKQQRGGASTGWSATDTTAGTTFKGVSVEVSAGSTAATNESDLISIFRTGVPEAQALDADGTYATSIPVTAIASTGTDVSWTVSLPNYAAGTVFGDADVKVFTADSPTLCNAAGAPGSATSTVTSTADSAYLCFTAVKGAPTETTEPTGAVVTGETQGEPVGDTESSTVTVVESADPALEPSNQASFTHQLTGKK